jgi:hypothetical protein
MVTKDALTVEQSKMVADYAATTASPAQLWRREWDDCVTEIDATYNGLVSAGMPAEDARGLLPTNLLTRINYNTSLRGLQEHAGLRLCTQAQFEWRLVWNKILEAIRSFGDDQFYQDGLEEKHAGWQFDELATIFKPICYYRGSCQFNADVDRACKIKKRVEQNAAINRTSSEWHKELPTYSEVDYWSSAERVTQLGIPAIRDEEWMLDPSAARVSQ